MRTSEQIYHQVRWDQRFDPARFVLGVNRRGAPPKRIPLADFVPGGEIPWHRVLFIEADDEVVWDRAAGVDRLDASEAGRVRERRLLRAPFFAALTPHVWDPAMGWVPGGDGSSGGVGASSGAVGSGSTAVAPSTLRVLTWNTLWDRYDSDRISTARRRPLLIDELAAGGADVIALQEVEPALLHMLADTDWVRAHYTLHLDPVEGDEDVEASGLLVLSRLPVRESAQHMLGPHKAVAAVVVETPAGPLVVASTHLTSDHSENGAARRDIELTRIAEGFAGLDADLLLVGDFNDGGDTPAAALGMRDAWTDANGPDDRTATFDPKTNPLAAVSSLSGRSSRLDRVLTRVGRARTTGAVLRGNRPDHEGLYVSDHFGVEVGFDFGEPGGADAAVLDVSPTARTALAWLPPDELRPQIQEIRRAHDPQIDRWPPHVNVLFGFVPESDFGRAAPLLAEAARECGPFGVLLDGVHTFGHRDDATVWLDPAAEDPASWAALRAALERRFPRCRGRAEGYTPHLTLGRATDPRRVAAECAARLGGVRARVGELVLLSRRGDEPMRVRAVLVLGSGELRWLPEEFDSAVAVSDFPDHRPTPQRDAAARDVAQLVAARLAGTAPGSVVHIVGSRRMGGHLGDADLDLVAAIPGGRVAAPDGPAATAAAAAAAAAGVAIADAEDEAVARVREQAAALPGVSRIRRVTGARVPGLRFTVDGAGGLDVDLVIVPTGAVPPSESLVRRSELGDPAALALSAVSDADAVLTAVGRHREAFVRLVRPVKAWARARGLDAAPFGGLPGIAWSVLAARTVLDAARDAPADVTSASDASALLRQFFALWAAWDWRDPIALNWPHQQQPSAPSVHPLTLLTPTDPVRNCAEQVTAAGRDLLSQELYRAWELLESTDGGLQTGTACRELFAPPPLHRRHASWAVVTVRRPDHGNKAHEFDALMGRVRGRMRALLTALAEAGATDAQAWPRPFDIDVETEAETGPVQARFAIGLGATPPPEHDLAAAAKAWTRGLPGVEVAFSANGGVPTLR
ncbi:poly(A) polymerase [Yinghuangia sp. YIM S09857]|uniref:poly(A) polymerase n=1 Tax=Yinghuangia sp. YIM S09857 TaxID=3436929 RepID=UPI003F53599E